MSGEQFFLLNVARRLISANVPVLAYLIFTICVLGTLFLWMIRDHQEDEKAYLRNALIVASAFMVLLAPQDRKSVV